MDRLTVHADSVMQRMPHMRPIGILRDAVDIWRRRTGMSRESIAQLIVEAHSTIGADQVTGILFDPPTGDPFERMRVNADRIFRWLDDTTKDRNLLPFNFFPSILAALPEDLRVSATSCLLRPAMLSCGLIGDGGDICLKQMFKAMIEATGETHTALADLLDGIDPGELERAETALACLQALIADAKRQIEHRITEDAR